MTPDNELPVWTMTPNWRNGVLERLEWLTDVIGSTWGTEQRRELRLSPRRTFEMTFNPVGQARSYFDLWLHRMGSLEFMVPLFHDKGRLTAPVVATQGTIPVDTTYREFVAGGMAIIIGDDPFTFDAVEITAVAANQLTIDGTTLAHGWDANTVIYPLRRTRISQESLFAALSNRVGEASLQFELNQSNDIPDEGAWEKTYSGLPLLLDTPNRRDNADVTYSRNSLKLDNETGLTHLLDDAGRAFTIQTYSRMMQGRADHWAFRQMLYRLRGRARPCWLPSFNEDMVLSKPCFDSDLQIDIKKIGYSYTGGVGSGRGYILFPGDLPIAAKIEGVGVAPSQAEERLLLEDALGTDYPAGTAISFLETTRLAQDAVEIQHHTDTDGTAECALTFRAYRNRREDIDTNIYPIPITPKRTSPCGDLTGLSWLLPCGGNVGGSAACYCDNQVSDQYQMTGAIGQEYEATWRIRGVVELEGYTGGEQISGSVVKNPSGFATAYYNRYRVEVSDPPAFYYLNNGAPGEVVVALDYELTFPIKGGATITLHAAAMDGAEVKNFDELTVDNDDMVRPVVVSQPYNGQFLQMDLMEVAEA